VCAIECVRQCGAIECVRECGGFARVFLLRRPARAASVCLSAVAAEGLKNRRLTAILPAWTAEDRRTAEGCGGQKDCAGLQRFDGEFLF
jgi:hypothetical protein